MASPTTSKPKCSPAQLEALAKARAAAVEKKKNVDLPKQVDLSEVLELVKAVKADMEMQFKAEMDAIDKLKVQLEEVKSMLPKKLDTSFLNKF